MMIVMGSLWITVGLPLFLGLLAVLGTLGGVALGQRNDHKRWLRDQRREAYAALITAVDGYVREPKIHTLHAIDAAQSMIFVLGPNDVMRACLNWVWDITEHAALALVDAPIEAREAQSARAQRSRIQFATASAAALGVIRESAAARATRIGAIDRHAADRIERVSKSQE